MVCVNITIPCCAISSLYSHKTLSLSGHGVDGQLGQPALCGKSRVYGPAAQQAIPWRVQACDHLHLLCTQAGANHARRDGEELRGALCAWRVLGVCLGCAVCFVVSSGMLV